MIEGGSSRVECGKRVQERERERMNSHSGYLLSGVCLNNSLNYCNPYLPSNLKLLLLTGGMWCNYYSKY